MKKYITICLMTICLVFVTLLGFSAQRRISSLSARVATIENQQAIIENQYANLSKETTDMGSRISGITQDIENLLEMNTAHENCVALALQMNSDSVMAATYDRSETAQRTLHGDDGSYALYYGRLYIPDAKIDVALYSSHKQAITDRADSANIFTWGTYSGENIADHNNQEFAKLFSVEVGTEGYIQMENGDIINIQCVDVFNGHNVGKDITDEEGVSAMGRADYMMYTCRNGWQNVRICLWNAF